MKLIEFKISFLLSLALFSITPYALQCNSGSTTKSLLFSIDVWKNKECRTPAPKCVRVEAEFSILNNYVTR